MKGHCYLIVYVASLAHLFCKPKYIVIWLYHCFLFFLFLFSFVFYFLFFFRRGEFLSTYWFLFFQFSKQSLNRKSIFVIWITQYCIIQIQPYFYDESHVLEIEKKNKKTKTSQNALLSNAMYIVFTLILIKIFSLYFPFSSFLQVQFMLSIVLFYNS